MRSREKDSAGGKKVTGWGLRESKGMRKRDVLSCSFLISCLFLQDNARDWAVWMGCYGAGKRFGSVRDLGLVASLAAFSILLRGYDEWKGLGLG